MSILPGSFLPKSRKTKRRKSKPKTRYKRKARRVTTRKSRKKGKLSPGLIKGMKALLRSKSPRVSAAMKAGIRKRLRKEGIRGV